MDSLKFRQKALAGDKLISTSLNTASNIGGDRWCSQPGLVFARHGVRFRLLGNACFSVHGAERDSTAPIVRLPSFTVCTSREPSIWRQTMLPSVNTPEDARNAVDYSRYPPHGTRGVSSVNRGVQYSTRFEEQLETAHLSTLPIAQVDSPMALGNLEEIAGEDGIRSFCRTWRSLRSNGNPKTIRSS